MSIKNNLRPASLAVFALLSSMALTAQAQRATLTPEVRRSYIVQLEGAPVASYTGGVAGLAATKLAAGTRLDVSASGVQAYMAHLATKRSNVLVAVDPAHVTFKFDVVMNGFAAMLTETEVRALKKNSNVVRIDADEMAQPHTSYTSTFLGLDKADGLWAAAGGKDKAGEGMIIAMVDSGVWPENLSFADKVNADGVPTHDASGDLAYQPMPADKWKGICETKAGIKASNCNNKLLGIRSFVAASAPIHPTEFLSGHDGGGHGTHTLSTAGGNANVPSTINAINMGNMSGVAPRARLASYKTCFTGTTATNGGCAGSSSIASINQAVIDGAHVINYSIGPTAGGGSFSDAVEVAFLNASNAGVFVAASAGNSGPATNPAANLGPWHATVAASTHDRSVGAMATVTGSGEYFGASVNQLPVSDKNLILSTAAGVAGADPVKLNLCYGLVDGAVTLDPALVAGKIVVCTRGATARVNKSAAVKAAGGVGMILADNGAGLVAEVHSVPTTHINAADGATVKSFVAANPAALGSIGVASVAIGQVVAPQMAGFSSRGPAVANNTILKPDFTAPGVDIVAAYKPLINAAEATALRTGGTTTKTAEGMISGTSMSSPHIAGLAALVKQQRPDWTPAMIKSALMTTAGDTYDDGVNLPLPWSPTANANGRLPWAQGAGHVRPNLATDPGLVYDAGALDYLRFNCGLGIIATPAQCAAPGVGTIQAHNLNLPSITLANMMGTQTVTRTVTNVDDSTATYQAVASVPGFNVVVTPASFTIAPGAKQTFTVKLTRTSAAADTWAYGSLTWSDGTHTVRSPLTARTTLLAAPPAVSSEAQSGSKVFTIGTGFAGAMAIDKGGLKAATQVASTVKQALTTGDTDVLADCRAGGVAGKNTHSLVVPADNLVTRVALFDADTGNGQGKSDLDLLVFSSAEGQPLIGNSGTETANEMVTLNRLPAGTYKVCVLGYKVEAINTAYKLSSWTVSAGEVASGALKVLAPAKAYVGGTASVGASWSGLAAGQRYLGAASFKVDGAPLGLTVLEVNTNDPVPLSTAQRPAAQTQE